MEEREKKHKDEIIQIPDVETPTNILVNSQDKVIICRYDRFFENTDDIDME